MLNTTLITKFNTAAEFFSNGNYSHALEAYQNLFTPNHEGDQEAPSESFCLEVRIRIAACLIELGDFTEARFELENQHSCQLLASAGPAQMEAYYFTFGNVIAKLGDYETADRFLKESQTIALNQLKDFNAADRIYRFRLHWAHHFAQWQTLLELAKESREFASASSLPALMHWSTEALCFALRGLHQYAEAKQGAEMIHARLTQSGARPEHIMIWTRFISELTT